MKDSNFHHLCIITTGGTIEKTYDEHDGRLENNGALKKDPASFKTPLHEL